MPATLEVIGREAELTELAAFIRAIAPDPDAAGGAAAPGPSALILEGEPGIGKTALWTAAVAAAGDAVLACRAARSETGLSLAGLSDLLTPVIDEVLPALPGPLARALEIALLRADAGATALEQRALMAACAEVFRLLSSRGPLVIAVDDAQWLDRSTAAVLGFALRRLGDEPVGLLVSLRVPDEGGPAFDPATTVPGHRVTRLTIGPLPAGALTRMLRSRVSPDISWPTARRIHEAARGNPLHALELARALGPAGHSIDEPLRVPPSLRQLVGQRLAALPRAAGEALLLAAAAPVPRLARLTAAMDGQPAEDAIDPAVAAGIVAVDDDVVRFAHPLWSAAAYSSASPRRRRVAHRRLAEVASDPEERARHLALAADGPDEAVAQALESAAGRAAGRGAIGAAAELAGLAARLTPDPQARLLRSIEAAEHVYLAGDQAHAIGTLEELASAAHGPARARVLLALGRVRTYDLDAEPVLAVLRDALANATGDDILAAKIHLTMAWICESDLPTGLAHARTAADLLAGHDEPALLSAITVAQLAFENLCGNGMRADLVERALALEQAAPPASVSESARMQLGSMLVGNDDPDGARALLVAALEQISPDEPEAGRVEVLSALVHAELLAGNLDAAERRAADAAASIELAGYGDQWAWGSALELEVDAARGRAAKARGRAAVGLRHEETIGSPFGLLRILPTLGFIALSQGLPAEAAGHLARADEMCERIGMTEPGRFRFHADYAEALISVGELDRANEVIDRLEARGRQLGRRWALATGARCRALLAMARGDADVAAAALTDAFAWHEGLPIPFELGRTHLVAGEVHRRCKRKKLAAGHLRAALEIFDRLGSSLWSARAATELARVGLRRESPFELTETERQVAELVAGGLTNREVAARMFISLRTVESTLSRVYRKLGLRSRTELARGYQPAAAPNQRR